MARARSPTLRSLLSYLALFIHFLSFALPTIAAAGSQNPFGDDDDAGAPAPQPAAGGSGNSGGAAGNLPAYECPRDNGKTYTTNGITFELQCDKGTYAKNLLSTTASSRTACADICAQNLQCKSCDFRDRDKNCALFSEYQSTVPATGVHTWFPIKDPAIQRREAQQAAQQPAPQPARPPVQQPAQPPIAAPPSQGSSSGDPAVLTPPSSGSSTGSLPAANPNAPQGSGKCPEDNEKTYVTPDGTWFQLRCGVHSKGTTLVGDTKEADLKSCMDKCAVTKGCMSVTFNSRPTQNPANRCEMYAEGGDNVKACGTGEHDMAFTIDPPEADADAAADVMTIKCSLVCPYANGQTWNSPHGESFHMDCGSRHGTKVLYKDHHDSFQSCMGACAAMIPCHSVDYHESSGTCYFSNHHGEPGIKAPGYSSAHSMGCGGSCGSSNQGQDTSTAPHPPSPPVPVPPVPAPPVPAPAPTLSNTEYCPDLDGKTRVVDGRTYKVHCDAITGFGEKLATNLKNEYTTSLQQCAADCTADPKCMGINFRGSASSGGCNLKSKYTATPFKGNKGDSTSNGPSNWDSKGWVAFIPIDPPPQDASAQKSAPSTDEPDLSCGNQGLAYAIYPNKRNGAFVPRDDKDFDPEVFKQAKPEVTGQTRTVGVRDSNNIYGNKPSNSEFVVVNHRGFFYAPQDGEYTFTVPVSDNTVAFWVGDNVINPRWTRSNVSGFQEWGGTPAVFKMTMKKGQYYPLRVMWANAGGAGSCEFQIKGPDGRLLADSKAGESKYLVTHSCDGVAPKPLWAFGQEGTGRP